MLAIMSVILVPSEDSEKLVSVVGLGQLEGRSWLLCSVSADSSFSTVESCRVKGIRLFIGRQQGSAVKKGLQPRYWRELESIAYTLPAPSIEENSSQTVPSSRICVWRRWSMFNSFESSMSLRNCEGDMERGKLRTARHRLCR